MSFQLLVHHINKKLVDANMINNTFDFENNTHEFRNIAEFTSSLSEDIFCNSLDQEEGDDDLWDFLDLYRYSLQVSWTKKIKGDPKQSIPKTLIYDRQPYYSSVPSSLIIAFRGTHSSNEWDSNFDMEEVRYNTTHGLEGYFHKNFLHTAEYIYEENKKFFEDTKKAIILTGFGRAGAIAQIVTVLAKDEFPEKEIYCFSYGAPPAMKITNNEENLTKGIYLFINNLDPIPHMFVEEVLNLACGGSRECNDIDRFKNISKSYYEISKGTPIPEEAKTGLFGAILSLLGPTLNENNRVFVIDAILNHFDKLKELLEQYKKNTLDIHIKEHTGTLYGIKSAPINKCDTNTQGLALDLSYAKLGSPAEFPRFYLTGTEYLEYQLNDHDPRLYRHAIEDPKDINLQIPEVINRSQPIHHEKPPFIDEISKYDQISIGPKVNDEYPFLLNIHAGNRKRCFGGLLEPVFEPTNITWVKCISSTRIYTYINGISSTEIYCQSILDSTRCRVDIINPDDEGLSTGAITGIIIGSIVGIAVLFGLIPALCCDGREGVYCCEACAGLAACLEVIASCFQICEACA